LDEARDRLARCIGAEAEEVYFTSGGTEGDNAAILGSYHALKNRGRRAVVTTPIEHKAILAAVHHAAHEGAEERLLAVTRDGLVDRTSFDALVRDDVAVCSIMWVNNEIGVVQPIDELARAAKARDVIFHTDAVQAFGKFPVDARQIPFDFLTLSGHKIGAPKGIGAIYIRRGVPVEPLFHGGSQDRGRRPGTENVAAAIGLARAVELAVAEQESECARLEQMRERLEQAIIARVPDAMIHGRGAARRAPHIVNVSVPGTDSESLLMALDLKGIACSAGSACQSGSVSPSHVLSAIGVGPELASAAIRMSLGVLTTPDGIDRVAEVYPALIERARGRSVASSAAS
jgi:cysteine desulfurase